MIDRMTGAPPAFAPSAPSRTRHRSETATTSGINCCAEAAVTTASGMIAPALNVAADVNAACRGRAVDMSEIPSRSEEHTSELQSLMRISYAVFCLKKKTQTKYRTYTQHTQRHNENQYAQQPTTSTN